MRELPAAHGWRMRRTILTSGKLTRSHLSHRLPRVSLSRRFRAKTRLFARLARGTSLSVLSLPYVEAARSIGASRARMILRYLLPNIAGSMIVLASVHLSSAILTEAGLSFLGLGTQPPEPSWGGMLSDSRTYMELAPWLAVFPGLAIMLVVLGFNFLGDGLRDWLDPRQHS